jgi:hypothetical protein
MRIATDKEAFNRKMSLLTSKLNIELKNKLVRCYIWGIALYGSETWTLRKLEFITPCNAICMPSLALDTSQTKELGNINTFYNLEQGNIN